MNKQCKSCGMTVPDTANFCRYCGGSDFLPLSNEYATLMYNENQNPYNQQNNMYGNGQASQFKPKKNNTTLIIIAVIAVLALYFGSFFAVSSIRKRLVYGWPDNGDTFTFYVDASGDCGDGGSDVYWTLYDDGHLWIDGDGAMADFDRNYHAPWYEYREKIYCVTVCDGITRIGDYAFTGLDNLIEIDIAENVTSIGESAFENCRDLDIVALPEDLTEIEDNTFCNCISLDCVYLSENLQFIGEGAFCGCLMLSDLDLPDEVTYIGSQAFADCDLLESVTLPESVTALNIDAFSSCDSLYAIVINNPECVIKSDIDSSVIIAGYVGSTAEEYAKKHNKKFISIDGENSSEYAAADFDLEKLLQQYYFESRMQSNSIFSFFSDGTCFEYYVEDPDDYDIEDLVQIGTHTYKIEGNTLVMNFHTDKGDYTVNFQYVLKYTADYYRNYGSGDFDISPYSDYIFYETDWKDVGNPDDQPMYMAITDPYK